MLRGLQDFFGTQTPGEATAQARKEQLLADQYGYQILGLESPLLDPIDSLASGVSVLSKGALKALAEAGSDAIASLVLDQSINQDADHLKAIYIGKRGIKALGIDASKDLAGQFSGLHDKMVRKEIESSALIRPLTTADNLGPAAVPKVMETSNKVMHSYPELGEQVQIGVDTTLLPNEGSFNTKSNTITLGPLDSPEYFPEQQKAFTHELQHSIDTIEGMPRGGSPDENWVALRLRLASSTDDLKKRYEDAELKALAQPTVRNKEEAAALKTEYYDTLAKVNDMTARIKVSRVEGTGYDNYWRLAGEEQARDATARAEIEPEKLATVQPFSGTYFYKGQQKSIYPKPLSVEDLIIDYSQPVKSVGNVTKSISKPLDVDDIQLD